MTVLLARWTHVPPPAAHLLHASSVRATAWDPACQHQLRFDSAMQARTVDFTAPVPATAARSVSFAVLSQITFSTCPISPRRLHLFAAPLV
ncbi:hypothetical protein EJ03DRAFT_324145 [Teratosphaeria nubilosa]|uniref:Uncharacterized protein n=1 Tax=Teratosphaeria nubilosa TaxID=161662 RepID=A0A6G1LLQ1_9PEZI|nr:hypothetical protein EJ03DRAFT_324145 [Teratosphaeria nubilosa]